MTADQKRDISAFLDIAEDYVRDGYRIQRPEGSFSDDPEHPTRIPVSSTTASPLTGAEDSMAGIAVEISSCEACRLSETRRSTVPGEGAEHPLVMVIGEGPGADEDASGRPFVGKAGQLLDRMLSAIGLFRETNCFIANVVKCRPPNNRDPEGDELAACSGFIDRQIATLAPRVILTVGRVATQSLLKTEDRIGQLRGRFFDYRGIPLLPTYHPSALLRDESLKRPSWEDLKLLRGKLLELDAEYARSVSDGND